MTPARVDPGVPVRRTLAKIASAAWAAAGCGLLTVKENDPRGRQLCCGAGRHAGLDEREDLAQAIERPGLKLRILVVELLFDPNRVRIARSSDILAGRIPVIDVYAGTAPERSEREGELVKSEGTRGRLQDHAPGPMLAHAGCSVHRGMEQGGWKLTGSAPLRRREGLI